MRVLLLAALMLAGCYGAEDDGPFDLPPAGPGGDCDRELPPCPHGWTRTEQPGDRTDCTSPDGERFFYVRYDANGVGRLFSTLTFSIRCDADGVVESMVRKDADGIVCAYECETCVISTTVDANGERVPYPICDDAPPAL